MLFDPLEEQLYLPAALVDAGDSQGRKKEVVGQKLQPQLALGIEVGDAPQGVRIYLGRGDGFQNHGLVGADSGAFVDGVRIASLEQDIFFGAHHKECGAEGKQEEALEIDVAAIHNIESPGFGNDLIKDVHVMHFAVGNADKRGNIAVQVQQRVHFDGGLVGAESSPGEQRETQVNRGGIQGVQALIQIGPDGVVGIEGACGMDQHLSKVGKDAPVVRLVRVRQGRAGHPAAKTNVVELVTHRLQASFNVAQTLAVS